MQQSVRSLARWAILTGLAALTVGCGSISSGDSGLFGRRNSVPTAETAERKAAADAQRAGLERAIPSDRPKSTIWDLFSNRDNPSTTVAVNRYLWNASLEVLDFLPKETVDPFTGVIVTGYGTPPGGGRAYRATILVDDPALDARSLKVSLSTKSGPVDAATQRAVEDAILTRARQLRVRDGKL